MKPKKRKNRTASGHLLAFGVERRKKRRRRERREWVELRS